MTSKEKIFTVLEEIVEQKKYHSEAKINFRTKELVSRGVDGGDCYRILCKLQNDGVITVDPEDHCGYIDFEDPNGMRRLTSESGVYAFSITSKLMPYLEQVRQEVETFRRNAPKTSNESNEEKRDEDLRILRKQNEEILKTVKNTDQNVYAVAQGNYKLSKENEELKALEAKGYLQFVAVIEPKDFQYFATILLVGNCLQAATKLHVPPRTFYDQVNKWKKKGPEYRRMFRLKEKRKSIKVRLPDSILYGDTKNSENPEVIKETLNRTWDNQKDYPGILRDILKALVEMNANNFEVIRDGLIADIKDELPQ